MAQNVAAKYKYFVIDSSGTGPFSAHLERPAAP
jgi:hypothetical protein